MITLGSATAKVVISAPLPSINLGEWLFTLTSEEYAACAEGHQSAAQGVLPSGKRVSINLEVVGGFTMVQHYVESLSRRDHVKTISPNSVLWINEEQFVLTQISWELTAKKISGNQTEITCQVTAETANEAFAKQAMAAAATRPKRETPLQLHINEETPLFAKDIERKALASVWG